MAQISITIQQAPTISLSIQPAAKQLPVVLSLTVPGAPGKDADIGTVAAMAIALG